MSSRKLLSRRTMLRGALGSTAIALGLPSLEAMIGTKSAHAETLPPIFGIFFWAGGMPWHDRHGAEQGGHPDLWTPTSVGANYAPTELLAPLAPFKPSIVTGLEPKTEVPGSPPGQDDGHMRGFMVTMTGDRIRPDGFDHPSHTLTALRPTLDRYVANHDAFYPDGKPLFDSLTLGVSTSRFHDYGHWNAISYNGPDALNQAVSDPTQLFNALFSIPTDTALLDRRASLIDAIKGDADDLKKKLGSTDRARVEAHLDHLNEIQTRLRLARQACEAPGAPGANGALVSGDVKAKTAVMAELLAKALACDLTRCFSFMLTSPATNHFYNNLPSVTDAMHPTVHAGAWEATRQITLHQMEAFAIFLGKLQETTDAAGGNLYDRACVFGTSEYGEGFKHSTKELACILAGGANGKLRPGVHVREQDGNISKAQVTMLRAIGIPTPNFGFSGGETSDQFSEILVG